MVKAEGLCWPSTPTDQNTPIANRDPKLTAGDKMYFCDQCKNVFSIVRHPYPRPGHYEFEKYPKGFIPSFQSLEQNLDLKMEVKTCGDCRPDLPEWQYGSKYKNVKRGQKNGNG